MTENTGLDADEALDIVSRRALIMEALLNGPKYNRDIRDELDVSRSTAYKAVSELEELGMARRGDDGYELTPLGRLLFDEYRRFLDRITDICRPGRLLAALPRETELPFAALADAAVSVSDRHAPNEPVREVERLVDESSAVKGTGPVVLPRYAQFFSDQLASDELEAQLVFERPVFDHLRTDYEEYFQRAIESDNLDVWVTDAELPYGLLVIEEPTRRVAIIVYESSGALMGVISNDTERAYHWGREQWERYRSGASSPSIDSLE
ncbi:helix-turn-helix transcriptional regulator [Natrinema salsiterrestre]|uniref:Uncharacterized protein n=1 Tax=Natrinema salsiterrestre TaxID=2950540 RepID=A0A9Q4Q2W8_9EURY|nr:HTH domain-containing protein [Natrinema salsiterrestre]MDF9746926.1 hypothetical protein [Natrinema salsiterrestre]